tara:strand:- start:1719 stop:2276 length:558 start_codon:yes stop_codon:yes gene_type:complete
MNPTFFENPIEFRNWLKKNHLMKTELLVGFYKVKTGKASISWTESVDQALCFGWIDGVRKSIDAESYCIRFTPRKTTSIWSAINIKKVEELTNSGLMTDSGHKAFSFRTEKKSKIYAYEKEPVSLNPIYIKQFKNNKTAWIFFEKQAPSYKKVIIHWIMSAKKEETRLSRLEKAIFESLQERRMR